jgi:hypothetical protein
VDPDVTASNAYLADACSSNLATAFEVLIPHSGSGTGSRRQFGAVTAIATGIPIPFYNPILLTAPGATAGDVLAADRFVRGFGVAPSAQVRLDLLTDEVQYALDELGLVCDEPPTPGMAMHPVPEVPRGADVEIKPVTAELYDDWHTAIEYGPRFRRTYPVSLVEDPAFRFVVGYADGEPVSGAAAVVAAGVVGIYAVGTAERARRRGFGAAVTWAAIDAGVRAGATVAVLQTSPEGESVYRAMGFREVCRYAEYGPADPPGE